MTTLSEDDSKRRPWPRAHEVSYWRVQLLRHMATAQGFKEDIDRLRSMMEMDNDLVARKSTDGPSVHGGSLDPDFALISEEVFSDPISVYHILFDGGETEPAPYTKKYQYPYHLFDTVRRLGPTDEERPALWAVEKLHRVVLYGIGSLVPELTIYWSFERHIHIRVTSNGGSVSVRSNEAEGQNKEVLPHSVLPYESLQERFGSDADWGNLRALAVKAAEKAVEEIRTEFESRYVHKGHGMRNDKRNDNWEISAERIALQLTGRAFGNVTSDARRHFCALIGIDNPGVPKRSPY